MNIVKQIGYYTPFYQVDGQIINRALDQVENQVHNELAFRIDVIAFEQVELQKNNRVYSVIFEQIRRDIYIIQYK